MPGSYVTTQHTSKFTNSLPANKQDQNLQHNSDLVQDSQVQLRISPAHQAIMEAADSCKEA